MIILLLLLLLAAPAWGYIENTAVQTISTTGSCGVPMNQNWAGPEASNDKIYAVYMTDTSACVDADAEPHNLKVWIYDYNAGTSSTTSNFVTTFTPSCCDGHDTPSLFRNSSGILDVVYGATVDVGSCGPAVQGPFYNTSSDTTGMTWGSRQRIPFGTTGSEMTGGYDASGTLHLISSGQCSTGGGRASERIYNKRTSGGSWSSVVLIQIDPTSGGTQLFRGEPHPGGANVIGSTIHLVWQRLLTSSQNATDAFYAKSTDGGTTWSSADGSASFSTSSPLIGTWNSGTGLNEYPSNYQITTGGGNGNIGVGALSDGTPVAVVGKGSSGLIFYRWTSGTSWTATTIDTTSQDVSNVITVSNGDLLVYGVDTSFNLKEYKSTNSGSTWTTTTLQSHTCGSPTCCTAAQLCPRFPQAKKFSNVAGKERVIVQWARITDASAPSASEVGLVDRPQTAASAVAFSDLFNRANNTDLGSDWTPETGLPMQIVGNRIRPTVTGSGQEEIVTSVSPANDQYASVLIPTFTSGGVYGDVRAIVRAADPGVSRQYYVCLAYKNNGGTTSEILYRSPSSGVVSLTTESATTWAAGDRLECRAVGTTISLYRTPSGSSTATLLLSVTDSNLSSGRIGVGARDDGAVSNIELDNYNAGDYPPTSTVFPNFPVASDYPSVAVLDSFTRANSGSLGANWTVVSGGGFTIASNAAAAPASTTENLYTANTLQQDHEVYGTWSTIPACCGYTTLIDFAGTTITANSQYKLQINRVSGGNALFKVIKVDSGGSTTSTPIAETDLGGDIVDGNSFGIRVSGTTLSAYWKYSDGIWYRIGSVTDATLPVSAVYGGISGASPVVIDDFGAGPLTTQPPQSPPTPFTLGGQVGRFGTTFPGVR